MQGRIATGRGIAVRAANVRRTNLGLVLDRLRTDGSLSRSDLVLATGLTRNAIGELVRMLVDGGLATEDAAAPDGRPGRPSPVVRIDDARVAVLAVEIGVDGVTVAVVGLDGAVLAHERVLHTDRVDGTAGLTQESMIPVEGTIVEIVDVTRRLGCAAGSVLGRRLVGVGVAVPGLVRIGDDRVINAPNLGWTDLGFTELLRSAFAEQLRTEIKINVANEADLGALAEARFGAGRFGDVMVFVSGEVGVGGGIVTNGERLAGHAGFAGEIGHFPVDPDGERCRCGGIGCWETVVGERALLARAGLEPTSGSNGVDHLIALARRGDRAAEEAFATQGRWLGIGIAGLINIFDPDVVVLGGLFLRILDEVRPTLDAELAARRFHGVERRVAIVGTSLQPSAAVIGAAELAFAPMLADPAAA